MSVKTWFSDSRREIRKAFGSDYDLFCRLLAATSLVSTIETNVQMAIRAYQHMKWFGEIPRTGFTEVHFVSIHKFMDDVWQLKRYDSQRMTMGRKVWSLYQNLIGNEQVCLIDRWMLRYFGYAGDRTYLSQLLYDQLEQKIKDEAAGMGITPAQRQVQLWCSQRSAGSTRGATSYGDIIRKKGITREGVLRRLL